MRGSRARLLKRWWGKEGVNLAGEQAVTEMIVETEVTARVETDD